MKDILGGCFMDMNSGMDKNGGSLVSTKKRSRICIVN